MALLKVRTLKQWFASGAHSCRLIEVYHEGHNINSCTLYAHLYPCIATYNHVYPCIVIYSHVVGPHIAMLLVPIMQATDQK